MMATRCNQLSRQIVQYTDKTICYQKCMHDSLRSYGIKAI